MLSTRVEANVSFFSILKSLYLYSDPTITSSFQLPNTVLVSFVCVTLH